MDPLVDKIMTMSAFICLVSLGSIPAWAVIVIVSREFLITGLAPDGRGSRKGASCRAAWENSKRSGRSSRFSIA